MKTLQYILTWLVLSFSNRDDSSVLSFCVTTSTSISTSATAREDLRLHSSHLSSDVDSTSSSSSSPTTIHTFWGQTRKKEEIRKYVSSILFPHENYIHTRNRINILSTELPLITIDDFIPPEMCNEIIQTAKESDNMKLSTLGAEQTISDSRTSSTTWIREEQCEIPLRVLAGKVSRLVGLDTSHMENLQVVRYKEGQKFDMHTDHLDDFNHLDCKGRLATCLVYLNSANDEDDFESHGGFDGGFDGGSTHFPQYDADVVPKQGRAVFWFNTMEKPGSDGYTDTMFHNVDLNSVHAGNAIQNGEKWVCNRWVHPIPLNFGVRDETGVDLSDYGNGTR